MTTKLFRSAAFVLAAALAGVPAVSQAATAASATPVHVTYRTSLRPQMSVSVPWTGTLQLTINPDGIIQGYYHPAGDETAFIPVTGGRNNDRIWLDIGNRGRLHIEGTLHNGVITGSAFNDDSSQPYDFSARAAG